MKFNQVDLNLLNTIANPVSYTHLDVYKRQLYIQLRNDVTSEVKISEEECQACLLYTSRCV